MKVWQILGRGEGFLHEGSLRGFELSGFVVADGPDEAFARAISLAECKWPVITLQTRPPAVINPDEVEEIAGGLTVDLDRVDLIWDEQEVT